MTHMQPDERILVTGASGVMGVALITQLRAHGYRHVVAVSRQDCDLRRERATTSLFRAVRPDVVFHLAARVYGIMGNSQHGREAYLDNIRINTNVVESAHRARVKKVVAMGSTAMYSDIVPLPMREEDVWLGPPHASEGPYAHAKRAMLAQLEAYREDGLDFALVISTNLYGPHARFDERWGHVVPSLISRVHHAIRDGTELRIWGSGTPQRDFLYSADAARALRLIGEGYSGMINVASGRPVTIRDLVDVLVDVSGYVGSVSWDTSMPDGQHMRQYDVSRLTALGFTPRYSLRAGLAATFRWYARHYPDVRR